MVPDRSANLRDAIVHGSMKKTLGRTCLYDNCAFLENSDSYFANW